MENLQDILDTHAAELTRGRDISSELLSTYGEQFPKLSRLLRIANRLREVLIPQAAPADFVVLLRNDLKAFDEQPDLHPIIEHYGGRRQNRLWLLLGSVAGTVAGVVGLILWLRRRPNRDLAADPTVA